MITPGDRIGLVGRNGAGKSTIFKIITGNITPEKGTVNIQKSVRIGYLSQDIELVDDSTLLEEVRKAFAEKNQLDKRVHDIIVELEQRTDYESDAYTDLITEMTDLQEKLNMLEMDFNEGAIENVLLGLGFKREEFDKLTSQFSGGWRMRIELAKLLLAGNDILLLDEPTNHLDIPSIIWMEEFLKTYSGAVVVIAHDRMLLDRLSNKTFEVVNGKLYDYKAPYSKFLELRKERVEKQIREKANQEQYVKDTEKLIEKFRAKASKAAFAQTLIRKLDKLEEIEIDDQDLSSIRFNFPVADHSGKVVLEIEGLTKSYGDHRVLSNIDLMVNRGDKILLLGANGQGKSTFLKAVMNEIDYKGKIEEGYRVIRSYYAQEQTEAMNKSDVVLDIIEREAPDELRPRARTILGSFLFKGDDVYKTVGVLSGGERARLALCRMFLHPSNFLVLDEPTNHLDIDSKEVLKRAIEDYTGTVLVVSHDRSFLNGLGNRLLEVKNGKINELLMDAQSYFKKLAEADKVDLAKSSASKEEQAEASNTSNNDYEKRKQIRKFENALDKLDKEIEALELELSKVDPADYEQMQEKGEQLRILNAKYENTFSKLEKISN
jgi:ATP-binding cassette subfamily F protein 3